MHGKLVEDGAGRAMIFCGVGKKVIEKPDFITKLVFTKHAGEVYLYFVIERKEIQWSTTHPAIYKQII